MLKTNNGRNNWPTNYYSLLLFLFYSVFREHLLLLLQQLLYKSTRAHPLAGKVGPDRKHQDWQHRGQGRSCSLATTSTLLKDMWKVAIKHVAIKKSSTYFHRILKLTLKVVVLVTDNNGSHYVSSGYGGSLFYCGSYSRCTQESTLKFSFSCLHGKFIALTLLVWLARGTNYYLQLYML